MAIQFPDSIIRPGARHYRGENETGYDPDKYERYEFADFISSDEWERLNSRDQIREVSEESKVFVADEIVGSETSDEE
jgi:hypothetical protein